MNLSWQLNNSKLDRYSVSWTVKFWNFLGLYRGVQATAILSILSLFAFIGAAIVLKMVLKKRTLIPIIVLGVSTGMLFSAKVYVDSSMIYVSLPCFLYFFLP